MLNNSTKSNMLVFSQNCALTNTNTQIKSKKSMALKQIFASFALGLSLVFASICFTNIANADEKNQQNKAEQALQKQAQIAQKWNKLIKETQDYAISRQAENAARDAVLSERKSTYSKALRNEKNRLARAKNLSAKLEQEQRELENQIDKLEKQIEINSGFLGEVFAVFDNETKQFSAGFEDSFLTIDRPEIGEAINEIVNFSGIPKAEFFTKVWQILQIAIRASGEVRKFDANFVNSDGDVQKAMALRIGDFDLIGAQAPLMKNNGEVLLPYQHLSSSVKNAAADFFAGDTKIAQLDPSRGLTYILLERQPSLWQRINQGGVIGYCIILLGLFGLVVAAYRGFLLWQEDKKIAAQLQNLNSLNETNLLGKIIKRLPNTDEEEVLETALDEAMMREMNHLEKGLGFLKLLAGVEPLLGLLGTVSGMIATFQAITVFGSGDPSLMADGISQALVTTVLGLVTAVPILFAHLLLQSKSKNVGKLLEAETTSWLLQKLKQIKGV